jgi:hypothetical protein
LIRFSENLLFRKIKVVNIIGFLVRIGMRTETE